MTEKKDGFQLQCSVQLKKREITGGISVNGRGFGTR